MTETRDVPQYRVVPLREKRSRHCVVIPVIDEGDKIARQLERMRGLMQSLDVAIADGGSTEAALSRSEQASLAIDDDVHRQLAEGNQAYEQRFGRVFLIRAAGRSSTVRSVGRKPKVA